MAISVNTRKYEDSHGRKPRQPREYRTSPWAFQIDRNHEPVFITANYQDALKHAKTLAQYEATVLP